MILIECRTEPQINQLYMRSGERMIRMSKESWAPNKRATALTVLSLPGRARIIRETVCEGCVCGKCSWKNVGPDKYSN